MRRKQAASSVAGAARLDTLTVAAGDGAGGIQWDGVVQAVEQAVLSAQTAGRVARARMPTWISAWRAARCCCA